jgi:hypothetical protein
VGNRSIPPIGLGSPNVWARVSEGARICERNRYVVEIWEESRGQTAGMKLSGRINRSAKQIAFAVTLPSERLIRLFPWINKSVDLAASSSRISQLILLQRYASIGRGSEPPICLRDVEFRAYSQNSEDGILLYIFGIIGFGSRRSVEICAGDGIECNSANLIINHGWDGLLIDGDPLRLKRGRSFYRNCRDTFVSPPRLVNAWVTAENVNTLMIEHGFTGDIDLLSIDLDGMDYWIWRALEVVRPRVVVVECNLLWGPERAMTVPYDPQFGAYSSRGANYFGASLSAMVKLSKAKGYRLIGCEKLGFNAFFLREDLANELFPSVSSADCFTHPYAKFAMRHRLPNITSKEWIEV